MPIDVDRIDSASVVCRENKNCSELKTEVETSRQEVPSEAVSHRGSTLGDARCMLRTATGTRQGCQ